MKRVLYVVGFGLTEDGLAEVPQMVELLSQAVGAERFSHKVAGATLTIHTDLPHDVLHEILEEYELGVHFRWVNVQ